MLPFCLDSRLTFSDWDASTPLPLCQIQEPSDFGHSNKPFNISDKLNLFSVLSRRLSNTVCSLFSLGGTRLVVTTPGYRTLALAVQW